MITWEKQKGIENRLKDYSPMLFEKYIEASMTDNREFVQSVINRLNMEASRIEQGMPIEMWYYRDVIDAVNLLQQKNKRG